MLHAGQTFDRYEIDAVLGSGGMATVYRARHTQLGSVHALKVLSAGTKSVRDRLLQEGRVQASLRHPNLVVVTDVLDVGGQPALVMEYVDGPSLEEWLSQGNRAELDEAVSLFRGIVRGTRYAHRKGLIHRDLKPGNVLLSDTPEGLAPKIVDFGLVKTLVTGDGKEHTKTKKGPITQMGVAMGTPEYMAPEQIRDAASVDQRADLFSLGCIFYTLVCGAPPFTGRDMLEVFNKVSEGDYVPAARMVPGLPPAISEVIEGLLETDPSRRIQSCDELLTMLDRQDLLDSSQTVHIHPAQALHRARDGQPPAPPGFDTISRSSGSHVGVPLNPTTGWELRAALGMAPLVLIPMLTLFIAGIAVLTQPAPVLPDIGAGEDLSEVLSGARAVTVEDHRISVEAADPAEPDPPEVPEVEPSPELDAAQPGSATSLPPRRVVPVPKPTVIEKILPKKAAGSGTVQFTGNARHVWLVQGSKRYSANGSVPAGRYEILALFEGAKKPAPAGKVVVTDGAEVMLRCTAFSMQCRY